LSGDAAASASYLSGSEAILGCTGDFQLWYFC